MRFWGRAGDTCETLPAEAEAAGEERGGKAFLAGITGARRPGTGIGGWTNETTREDVRTNFGEDESVEENEFSWCYLTVLRVVVVRGSWERGSCG